MSGVKRYKPLYEQALLRSAERDRLIDQLQEQLAGCSWQMEQMRQLITVQQEELEEKEAHNRQQAERISLQERLLADQSEKLIQQETLLEQQSERLARQQEQLDRQTKELLKLDEIRHELRLLKRQVMGRKSERRHPAEQDEQGNVIRNPQLSLELAVDAYGICRITDRRQVAEHIRLRKETTPQKRGGRHAFPEGLEEEIIVLDVADKPAGARLLRYEEQRQLACDPLRWYIKVIRRPVYLSTEDGLDFTYLIAPLPAHPIERCKFDVSILVILVIQKYLYHLPVWRQQQLFRQYGISIPYSTLVHLVGRVCDVLEPLWHLLLKEITSSRLVHSDETRYKVLDSTKKKGKKSHLGWIWAVMNPVQRTCCFLYQPGRGKKDIRSVLQGYKGFLMTDGYGAYTKYGRQPGITHQQCLAHTRRYFVQALENDAARAGYALEHFFGPLYGIERSCKDQQLDYDAITEKRQSGSLPILQAFREWLQTELPQTTPRTPIHKAIGYALQHFDGLLHYTADGMLEPDNNCLEGQIRPITLGRNNHLFAGSHRGGQRDAMLYSFMATCKLHGIDPAGWLDDVLRRIGSTPEENRISLLPQYWKAAAPAIITGN
jgi:transposase